MEHEYLLEFKAPIMQPNAVKVRPKNSYKRYKLHDYDLSVYTLHKNVRNETYEKRGCVRAKR